MRGEGGERNRSTILYNVYVLISRENSFVECCDLLSVKWFRQHLLGGGNVLHTERRSIVFVVLG